jgi:16S rRNA processing protein RimM
MSIPENLVEMGYIAGPFGIQGWVKIKATTEYTDSLDDYEQIYLRLPNKQIVAKTIEKSAARDGMFHAKLDGVSDRDAAFALRGATVCVSRDDFPEPDEDEYYWVDLIGLTVINQQGETLGIVKDLMETGANDVIVVRDNQIERLIPFVAQFVIDVNLEKRQIIVDWGLDY